jgi:HAE1 family hydrophobic/amphiphilic exporter-1
MAWTLRHRVLASSFAALGYLSVVWPRSHMDVTPFGEDENTGRLTVWVELEENFTLAEAESEMAHYERFFEARRERYGFDHLADRFDARGGRITLYWDVPLASDRHTEFEREVERDLAARPGHRVRLWSDGGDAERNRNMVTFRLVGPEAERLEELGRRAVQILERVPGLTGVSVPEEASQSQVRVVFDSDLAQGFGITPDTALQQIAWALRGWQLPRYQEEGREVPLIIEYDDEEVAGLSTLRDLDISNGTSAVPLSSFARFQFARGQRSIVRVNGQTSFTIEARVEDPLRQKELSERGYRALRQLDLPRGFSIGEEDLVSTRQAEEFRELFAALVLSTVLVYVLMCILFESMLLPFAIMFTIPFAMVGSFWTLYVTGTAMDSVGWIGIIILVGVVVNNGIVLIDCIHGLHAGGMERAAAVLQGCAQRVRPVLMTALTTVIGLVPTAIAEPAAEGIDYRALATCVAGGLAVSTLFTLWVVPLAYTLLDDVWQALVERFEMFAALQGALSKARGTLAPHFATERSPSS